MREETRIANYTIALKNIKNMVDSETWRDLMNYIKPLEAAHDKMKESIKGELLSFVMNMQNELISNNERKGKKGWKKLDPRYLLSELQSHVNKLTGAMVDKNDSLIREHSADVGNLAMMIADVCGVLPEPPEIEGE